MLLLASANNLCFATRCERVGELKIITNLSQYLAGVHMITKQDKNCCQILPSFELRSVYAVYEFIFVYRQPI